MRLTWNSPVILGYVLLCAVVLAAASFVSPLALWYVSLPPSPDFAEPVTWLRLVTHVAGHADFEHFAANAVYLLLLGPLVEARYGSLKLLACLVATAAATGAGLGAFHLGRHPGGERGGLHAHRHVQRDQHTPRRYSLDLFSWSRPFSSGASWPAPAPGTVFRTWGTWWAGAAAPSWPSSWPRAGRLAGRLHPEAREDMTAPELHLPRP